MSTRHFLSSDDISAEEQRGLVGRALALKAERGAPPSARRAHRPLEGRNIGMIFEKPSTRTRVSFEVAVVELGGYPLVMRSDELQLGRGETPQDTGRVLSRYLDALVVRTFGQDRLEQLAETATVPIINALSDSEHPCQALADMVTIVERFGDRSDVTFAYVGDGNNVCHSLLLAGAKSSLGEIRVACPPGFEPLEPIVERAAEIAAGGSARIHVTSDPEEACTGADVVYTDVWVSMGQESERQERRKVFEGFRVDTALMSRASEGAIVMHCLPAHRGEEITDEVIDSEASAVWDQAENRLHAQKALLEWLLSEVPA